MSPELYQQVEPDEVGVSSAYLGNIDALQERYLAEDAYQGFTRTPASSTT